MPKKNKKPKTKTKKPQFYEYRKTDKAILYRVK